MQFNACFIVTMHYRCTVILITESKQLKQIWNCSFKLMSTLSESWVEIALARISGLRSSVNLAPTEFKAARNLKLRIELDSNYKFHITKKKLIGNVVARKKAVVTTARSNHQYSTKNHCIIFLILYHEHMVYRRITGLTSYCEAPIWHELQKTASHFWRQVLLNEYYANN